MLRGKRTGYGGSTDLGRLRSGTRGSCIPVRMFRFVLRPFTMIHMRTNGSKEINGGICKKYLSHFESGCEHRRGPKTNVVEIMCRLTLRKELGEEIANDLRSPETKIELSWLLQPSIGRAPSIHIFCAFLRRLETQVERISYLAAVTVLPEEQFVYQNKCPNVAAICQTFHPLATQSTGVLIAAKNNDQNAHTLHPLWPLLHKPNLAT